MDELLATPERFVMLFRPSMVEDDFGGILPKYARCIYSYWSGYLKQPSLIDLQKKLTSPEVEGEFLHLHTSGHIYMDDIPPLIRRIDPEKTMKIIPVHTFHREAFLQLVNGVEELEDGQTYTIT